MSPPNRRRKWTLIAFAVLSALAVLFAALFVAAAAGTPRTGSSTSEGQTFRQSVGLHFPDCALVTVSWVDADGGPIGFGAGPSAEAILATDCAHVQLTAPNPPDSCPPAVCVPGAASAGPGPFLYQTGSRGTFQFLATQGDYSFFEDQAPNSRNLSSDQVVLAISYTLPIVPLTPLQAFGLVLIGIPLILGVAVLLALVVWPGFLRRPPR